MLSFILQSLRNNNAVGGGGGGGLGNLNLLEITAQDLLGKSHEELVLLLIHVRRQAAALAEAADVARAELERNPAAAETRFVTLFRLNAGWSIRSATIRIVLFSSI